MLSLDLVFLCTLFTAGAVSRAACPTAEQHLAHTMSAAQRAARLGTTTAPRTWLLSSNPSNTCCEAVSSSPDGMSSCHYLSYSSTHVLSLLQSKVQDSSVGYTVFPLQWFSTFERCDPPTTKVFHCCFITVILLLL
uniref:Uncharacterized protein n=1 Tax=Mus musculus TaxID=10090 RepID=Q3UTF6_MOUSE|nr:unnamed protein product [Mus musculus]